MSTNSIQLDLELTNDQKEALQILQGYVLSGEKFITLEGYAGTGKTTLIQYLLSILPTNTRVCLTAPTNKAVKVLRDFQTQYLLKNPGGVTFECKTIHSLLGIRPKEIEEIQIDPVTKEKIFIVKEKFEPLFDSTEKHTFSDPFDLVVVDEASMVSSDLLDIIVQSSTSGTPLVNINTQYLFVGDPAQLPPVGEDHSQVFTFPKAVLTHVVRQAQDNPLIQELTKIRNNLEASKITIQNHDKHVQIVSDPDTYFALIESHFQNFKDNPHYARVIAWRNKTVSDMNSFIRSMLYGQQAEEEDYILGEVVMAKSPFIVYPSKTVVFQNSEEGIILDKKEILEEGFLSYELLVESLSEPPPNNRRRLVVLHPSARNKFDHYQKTVIEMAKKNKVYWKQYYDLKKKFAELEYAYSLTAHKSQGSTFDHVFVIKSDIEINPRIKERNQCLYVALSRCKNTAIVLQ